MRMHTMPTTALLTCLPHLFTDAMDLEPEAPEAPTKVVQEQVKLQVRARLAYYDFEGRSDGATVRR
jgi:hypothetical protein